MLGKMQHLEMLNVFLQIWNAADAIRLPLWQMIQGPSEARLQNYPLRPVIGEGSYTHIPPSWLRLDAWHCWPLLPLWKICVAAVCASSHLQAGPPTAEAILIFEHDSSLMHTIKTLLFPLVFVIGYEVSIPSMTRHRCYFPAAVLSACGDENLLNNVYSICYIWCLSEPAWHETSPQWRPWLWWQPAVQFWHDVPVRKERKKDSWVLNCIICVGNFFIQPAVNEEHSRQENAQINQ